MSDFELALLFSEYLNAANFVFSNFMAVVFAMLTASYFLAHRMGRWVAVLFLSLYSIGALMTGSGVLFAFTDFFNLGVHIHAHAASDPGDLAWLGPAGPGGEAMASMPAFVAAMLLTAYFGSIGFFFVVRHNRIHAKDEDDTAKPGDSEAGRS
ncbi:hypothetical protein [Hyphobacterium sp.]|uniref:hypothetical protein n=1 Tax=Hyphobacterium sp. TaxID=2004662 RepID=UPI003B522209